MTRRNIELVLLCVAAPIVILLFAMLALNRGQQLGLATLGVPIGLFAAFIIAHIATRFLAPDADPAILPIVFALSGIGIGFVTRLAPSLAVNQVIWLFVSVAAMVVTLALSRKLDHLANYKYTLMLFGFALLLSPLLPVVGTEHYGSRIWLTLGPFSFQPGELAKIVVVLAVSGYLAANREMLSVFTWRIGPFKLPDVRTLLPLLINALVLGMNLVLNAVVRSSGNGGAVAMVTAASLTVGGLAALICFFRASGGTLNVKRLVKNLIAAAVMTGVLWGLTKIVYHSETSKLMTLLIFMALGVLGIAVYTGVCWLLKEREALDLISSKFRKRVN